MSVWLSLALSSELCKVCRAVTVIILTQYDASRNLSCVNHLVLFFFRNLSSVNQLIGVYTLLSSRVKIPGSCSPRHGACFFCTVSISPRCYHFVISLKMSRSTSPWLTLLPDKSPPVNICDPRCVCEKYVGRWRTVPKVIRIVSQLRLLSPKSLEPTWIDILYSTSEWAPHSEMTEAVKIR